MAKITLDDLAASIQREFESLHGEINGIKQDTSSMKQDIVQLKQGQERIFLRLDHLAPHFEVKDLGERVNKLEIDVKILKSASH